MLKIINNCINSAIIACSSSVHMCSCYLSGIPYKFLPHFLVSVVLYWNKIPMENNTLTPAYYAGVRECLCSFSDIMLATGIAL